MQLPPGNPIISLSKALKTDAHTEGFSVEHVVGGVKNVDRKTILNRLKNTSPVFNDYFYVDEEHHG